METTVQVLPVVIRQRQLVLTINYGRGKFVLACGTSQIVSVKVPMQRAPRVAVCRLKDDMPHDTGQLHRYQQRGSGCGIDHLDRLLRE